MKVKTRSKISDVLLAFIFGYLAKILALLTGDPSYSAGYVAGLLLGLMMFMDWLLGVYEEKKKRGNA